MNLNVSQNVVRLAAITVLGVVGVTAVKQFGKLGDKLT